LKLPPEKSVLGLQVGEEVKLTEADFVRLADAFFAELEKRLLHANQNTAPRRRRTSPAGYRLLTR
jgi:hypothetical protein